jgi:hypothetical protein
MDVQQSWVGREMHSFDGETSWKMATSKAAGAFQWSKELKMFE